MTETETETRLDIDEILGTDVAVFDTETTGTDPETSRFVQVYAGAIIGGLAHHGRTWTINPGIPIPAAATEIHGITDADVEDADLPGAALAEIVQHLQDLSDAAIPIVVYNAPFDLTILHREVLRHGGEQAAASVAELLDELVILDPLVIDKALDRFRKGSRKLGDVAAHYGITTDEQLHDAGADARLAGRLMLALWRQPSLFGKSASHIHGRTVEHARIQAASYADYLHSLGQHDAAIAVDAHGGAWPWRRPIDHEHDYHHRGGASS